jgi:hypothetical protein
VGYDLHQVDNDHTLKRAIATVLQFKATEFNVFDLTSYQATSIPSILATTTTTAKSAAAHLHSNADIVIAHDRSSIRRYACVHLSIYLTAHTHLHTVIDPPAVSIDPLTQCNHLPPSSSLSFQASPSLRASHPPSAPALHPLSARASQHWTTPLSPTPCVCRPWT